jgi:hypothetical protein
LKPEKSIFAEIVRSRSLHDVHHALTFLIGILQRCDVHIGERFTVAIEDTARNRTRRHDLQNDVSKRLPRV